MKISKESTSSKEHSYRDEHGLPIHIFKNEDGTASILWADHSMNTKSSFKEAYDYVVKCVGSLKEE